MTEFELEHERQYINYHFLLTFLLSGFLLARFSLFFFHSILLSALQHQCMAQPRRILLLIPSPAITLLACHVHRLQVNFCHDTHSECHCFVRLYNFVFPDFCLPACLSSEFELPGAWTIPS